MSGYAGVPYPAGKGWFDMTEAERDAWFRELAQRQAAERRERDEAQEEQWRLNQMTWDGDQRRFNRIANRARNNPAARRQIEFWLSISTAKPKDIEVAMLWVSGLKLRRIAEVLGVSPNTVSERKNRAIWKGTVAMVHGMQIRTTDPEVREACAEFFDTSPWLHVSCDSLEERGLAPWAKVTR